MVEGTDSSQKRKARLSVAHIILVVVAVVVIAYVFLRPRLDRPRVLSARVACGTNIRGIANALYVYANDDEQNRLPPGDKWCDLLIGRDYTSPKRFVCKSSGAVEGESSYAINKYVAGKSLDRVPGDIVLVFETDFGVDPNGRSEPAGNRMCYKMRNEPGPKGTVYKYRWNLAGGAEILSTRNHDGKGCNVGFVDAHVEWVEAADLPKLKFKPDPNELDRVYESYSLTNKAAGHRRD